MFRENKTHLQLRMLTTVDSLPQPQSTRLAESWAGTFYSEFFSRINEKALAVLYSHKDSRPNIPVNILLSLEALKSGFGWSDEEMYDAFCFNLQVRYALGYRNLGEGQFDLRTIYNFRHRLSEHMRKTGENLVDKAFEQVTDEQIASFHLQTGTVRMDSSQIASNIRNMSRLHLLVEVVQRVHSMLNEADRTLYADDFSPFTQGTSGQYVYRVKGEDGPAHMQRLGELMGKLLKELAPTYGKHPIYQMLERVFAEHFLVEQERLHLKAGKELSSASPQSPDDTEATFRSKNRHCYRGHVANLTETCHPDNPFQLIAKLQVAPNVTNDDDMLIEAVPSLKERLDISEIYTDGGYGSEGSEQVLRDNGIDHVQTAICGHPPGTRIGLDQFEIVRSEADKPVQVTCPRGQTVAVEASKGSERYLAHFDSSKCSSCPLQEKCPTHALKLEPYRTLQFDRRDADVARRRQRMVRERQSGRNLRAAIESTIASLKQPFNYDQLPVRGLFRVHVVLLGSAVMANLRRIHRYVTGRKPEKGPLADVVALQTAEMTPAVVSPSLPAGFLSCLRSLRSNIGRFAIRQRQPYANC